MLKHGRMWSLCLVHRTCKKIATGNVGEYRKNETDLKRQYVCLYFLVWLYHYAIFKVQIFRQLPAYVIQTWQWVKLHSLKVTVAIWSSVCWFNDNVPSADVTGRLMKQWLCTEKRKLLAEVATERLGHEADHSHMQCRGIHGALSPLPIRLHVGVLNLHRYNSNFHRGT